MLTVKTDYEVKLPESYKLAKIEFSEDTSEIIISWGD